jgi:hypothetical protein
MFRVLGLPATAGQNLAVGFHLKEPLFVPCPISRPQRPQISGERLRVAALENAMWNEVPGF